MSGSRSHRRVRLVGGATFFFVAAMSAVTGGRPAQALLACEGAFFFDANGDGFGDLPIGAPNEDVSAAANAGSVTILMGTSTGTFTGTGSIRIVQDQIGQASESGDRFGASVTTVDWNPAVDYCTDLAIGIPGEDGARGRVIVVLGSASGLNLASRIVLGQGINGAADSPEAGDRFGEAMVAAGVSPRGSTATLAVGVPGEDVGTAADAGVVTTFSYGSSGVISKAGVTRRQGFGEIPDRPEAGDAFGSSLAAGGGYANGVAAVGVPGEDVGGVTDAGMVHSLTSDFAGHGYMIHQNSDRVPDSNEAGDRFGAAVGFNPGSCSGAYYSPGLMVGAPGEDLGGLADVGAVTMLEMFNFSDIGNLIRQGAGGIPDTIEAGDRFGMSLSTPRGEGEVAIGAPGEDVGSIADAGHVTLAHIGCDPDGGFGERDVVVLGARALTQNSTGVPDQAEAGDQFGARLGFAVQAGSSRYGGSLVVGAPAEGVAGKPKAGSVHVFPRNTALKVIIGSGQAFNQDSSGVSDTAETGDGFGLGLSGTPST